MRTGRLAGAALPIFLFTAASGCQLLQREPPPAPIAVRDAETGQPIPGATVRVSHLVRPAAELTGTTGPDGTARLAAAPDGDADVVLAEASVDGYLPDTKDVTLAVAHADAAGAVVELYAAPRPAVELVLPAGFRGKIEVHIHPDGTAAPGQRVFAAEVPASGVVQLSGPPILRNLIPPDFRARYADGTALRSDPADSEVGFRVVKTLDAVQYFVVGTKVDADALRKSVQPEGHGWSVGGEKGGGQRGGGGRRGGGRRSSPGGPG